MLMYWKTMFDSYYCLNSMIYSHKFTKSMALYFGAVLWSTHGWTFSLIFMFQVYDIHRSIKQISCHKFGPHQVQFQIHVLTTH